MTIVTFNYIPGPKTSRTVSLSLFLADSLAPGIRTSSSYWLRISYTSRMQALANRGSPFRLNLLVARENCNEEPTQYIEGTPKRLARQTNDGPVWPGREIPALFGV